jgi:hypothetical protein
MPMNYEYVALPDSAIPQASSPLLQHMLNTYASETNKVISVWRCFAPTEMSFRPHERSKPVIEIMKHQLLSERRFFGEFMGLPEPPPSQTEAWWLEEVPFFDVVRQRIWVFWRRVLHTCHHRAQLTLYLRLLNKSVPSTYGPTADVSWAGADPTQSIEAAGRKKFA